MNTARKFGLWLVSLLGVGMALSASGWPQASAQAQPPGWRLAGETWSEAAALPGAARLAPPGAAELIPGMGEWRLRLAAGRVSLLDADGRAVWGSPAGWQVRQALFSDLNRDGRMEAALLVWRAFEPWPVDRYLTSGGRIEGFHDAAGRACHLILIGWEPRGSHAAETRPREVWAGSALSRPLLAFGALDLDGDNRQELVALEGEYDRPAFSGGSLTAWEWNGFGFTLLARQPGAFRRLGAVSDAQGKTVVITW